MLLSQAVEEAKMMFVDLHPSDTVLFNIVDVEERKTECEWIDPFEGKFIIKGMNGFTDMNEYLTKDPHVDNMRIAPREKVK